MQAVIVTGASGAMGSAAVEALARQGRVVIMACRNLQKGAEVRSRILSGNDSAQLELLHLDLASQQSVIAFVAEAKALLESRELSLAGLFNNAGVMNRSHSVTEDGLEATLAVNCVNPILLTLRLLPLFAAEANVVNMVSLSCRVGKVNPEMWAPERPRYRQVAAYAQSKLAFMLATISLGERLKTMGYDGIRLNVADPGVVNTSMISLGRWFDPLTDLLFRPFCNSPQQGIRPALNALSTRETLRFFVGNKCKSIPHRYRQHSYNEELWKELQKHIPIE